MYHVRILEMQIQMVMPGSLRGNQLVRLLTYSPSDVS